MTNVRLNSRAMENSKEEKGAIVELIKNGPARITGDFKIVGHESVRTEAYICRCGGTKNAPFCDGSHLSQPAK